MLTVKFSYYLSWPRTKNDHVKKMSNPASSSSSWCISNNFHRRLLTFKWIIKLPRRRRYKDKRLTGFAPKAQMLINVVVWSKQVSDETSSRWIQKKKLSSSHFLWRATLSSPLSILFHSLPLLSLFYFDRNVFFY